MTEPWSRTLSWVRQHLEPGEEILGAERLTGGWTSTMRRIHLQGPGGERTLVLRSFVRPFYRKHADGLLRREAGVLRLLDRPDDRPVPAARLVAVDPAGEHCDHPSLLMTLLPGSVRLAEDSAAARIPLLAGQLVRIHRTAVTAQNRPRAYQAWTSPESVRVPAATGRPELWRQAVEAIRQPAPPFRGCFLHRDFHPGNVLFTGGNSDAGAGAGEGADTGGGAGAGGSGGRSTRDGGSTRGGALRISGVVDWVETSWGPAELDLAHCSTALALLHGVDTAAELEKEYRAAGGQLGEHQRYWRLLDALAFAPDAEKVAVPWRELGRTDLTSEVLQHRLEHYLATVLEQYR
ncbi:phosphotransferase family protein [Kitasatospora sp. NPDC056138]|uniref:phosphotransferase family protein n=1 Tax=Kitasatospora sp. NPDC056138 TaxID=3345724 RepID=UPI0035E1522E